MRERIFRRLLPVLRGRRCGLFDRFENQILLNLTARAFGVPAKRVWNRSPERGLREYAAFTAECMKGGQASPRRLYKEAYRTGRRIRRITGFTERRDLEQLVFLLYRRIRIDMSGRLPGEVKMTACYFSRFYTPEECRMMSCVDSGIIAGLFGGGKLVFSGRITEGCGACTACFGGSDCRRVLHCDTERRRYGSFKM